MSETRDELFRSDAILDLCSHWNIFCDADPFEDSDTFSERMEAAGLIELVPVTKDALDESFAAERGIEPGGMMWVLTPDGHAAMLATSQKGDTP